jgi:hypothetical protein
VRGVTKEVGEQIGKSGVLLYQVDISSEAFDFLLDSLLDLLTRFGCHDSKIDEGFTDILRKPKEV